MKCRTTLTCVLTEAGVPESAPETPLVHHRRFCVHSGPRGGHLHGRRSGMLLRLRRLLVHPDARQSAPRTPGPAGSPKGGREALAGCGRSSSHLAPARSTGGAGRDSSDQRDRGSSGRPVCSPVPDRFHAQGSDGGAPVRNPPAHYLLRASGPRAAAPDLVLPQRRRHDICVGPHGARSEGCILGVPQCVRDGQGRSWSVRPIDAPCGDNAVRRVQERHSYDVVSAESMLPNVACSPTISAGRAMRDEDGPVISKAFYEKLLEGEIIDADAIPYALDHAVRRLRESGASIERWASFIHVGA
jgi:hypothetical protein